MTGEPGGPGEPGDVAVEQPFWDGAAEGRLLVPRCSACGEWRWPPRRRCGPCDEPLGWAEPSGRGVVHSVSTVHRPPRRDAAEDERHATYRVAFVRLDEGPRLLTQLVGAGADRAAIGDPVTVTFLPADERHPARPAFEPTHQEVS